jgi:zinc protease
MPSPSFRRLLRVALFLVMSSVILTSASSAQPAAQGDVLKATLSNGLRVIVVRNTIAPVVSTVMTYLVGSRDDPASYPGMAHAQEHMLFRGTKNLSTSELGTLATALGGDFNAGTSDTITQYQFTVPVGDLDAILRVEADRMRDVLDAQSQWENERGAIEQEVLSNESAPGSDFFREAEAVALAGSPYDHHGVGTVSAFDKLTGPEIKSFYERWYAPNNAVFVVAGDVDPAATLAQIRARFDSIPSRIVPAHATSRFKPIPRTVLSRPTTLIYPLAVVGYRFPGITDPDFLASFVLQSILDSPRGLLHGLVDTGEALEGEWLTFPYTPDAQLGFASAALRPGDDPDRMTKRLEGIVSSYVQNGVPSELFESTKRRLIADQEQSRNSISALASDWATTIALDGEPSIAHEQELLAKITLADVNRVAKRYLDPQHAIVGALTPSGGASQNAPPSAPQSGTEKPLAAQPADTHLPDWAAQLVAHVAVTPSRLAPTRTKLANGITLIVQPETISNSVFVVGGIRTNAALQEPIGKEGVSSVLATIFDFGTQTRDRNAFQRAQDDLDSTISAGTQFSAQTTAAAFDRAVGLLAENELQPRFDAATFDLARRRVANELATTLTGSSSLAMRRASRELLPPGDPDLREPSVTGIQSLSLDDVKAYYAKTIRPDLATIVVIGNVTPAAARAAIERAFSSWHATSEAPTTLDLPAVPLNHAGEVHISIPTNQDSVMFFQMVGLARSSPDFYALLLGNAILGGGSLGPEQSRLFRDLRQNAGLVYSVGSRFTTKGARSEFSIELACLPSNEPRISAMIDAEIEKLQTEPVGAFELSLVKASIVRRTVVANSSSASIANALLDAASDGLPLDQTQIDAQRFLATDSAAIQKAFATYIHPKNFVRVIEGPGP